MEKFAVTPASNNPSIVIVDDTSSIYRLDASSSNSRVTQTPSGLQGEKEFFKLLILSEILNARFSCDHQESAQQQRFLNKIYPNKMFYRAKMIDKLKMNEFQEWIQRHIQDKLSSVGVYRDIDVK